MGAPVTPATSSPTAVPAHVTPAPITPITPAPVTPATPAPVDPVTPAPSVSGSDSDDSDSMDSDSEEPVTPAPVAPATTSSDSGSDDSMEFSTTEEVITVARNNLIGSLTAANAVGSESDTVSDLLATATDGDSEKGHVTISL